MKKLSPNKTFQHIVQCLFETKESCYQRAITRSIVRNIINGTLEYEFSPIYIPDGATEDTNIIFAVGEFDNENGCYPMHLDFVDGEMVPVYGFDKCIVARNWNHKFASIEYARKVLNAPGLTEHQLRLIVEEASSLTYPFYGDYMTDLQLNECYHRMIDGDSIHGEVEDENMWILSVKEISTNKINSVQVQGIEELINRIHEYLGCKKIYNVRWFVSDNPVGEIHTPELILLYTPLGAKYKMYIDPKCGKYVTESI